MLRSILDVSMMRAFCLSTYSLSELSISFFLRTWMAQPMVAKSNDVSKDNIVGAPSIVSRIGNKEARLCYTTLFRANIVSWGRLVEAFGT